VPRYWSIILRSSASSSTVAHMVRRIHPFVSIHFELQGWQMGLLLIRVQTLHNWRQVMQLEKVHLLTADSPYNFRKFLIHVLNLQAMTVLPWVQIW
jgi:hypothetical protein